MATNYNLIEEDKDKYRCEETVGLIEFLRRVRRKDPLPNPLRVQGLDVVLEEAQDTTATATVIRNLLAARSEWMGRQDVFVVFPMWADLEESGLDPVAYLPKGSKEAKQVRLSALFGNRLTRTKRYSFQAGSNLTRAPQSQALGG
ncbi:MAG: hypothetical protein DRI48_00885 [Chloroflexi bacterium]|nr:MAG: hypothetical protein DRI48_00885 [Chloroflexota bacterium]